MKYIKRNSDSDTSPQLVEYLQAGILVRFAITPTTTTEEGETLTTYRYVEYWFSLDSDISFIKTTIENDGYQLTPDYIFTN